MEKPKAGRPRKYVDVVRILIYAPDAARAEIRAAAELIKARYLIDAEPPPAPDWVAQWRADRMRNLDNE